MYLMSLYLMILYLINLYLAKLRTCLWNSMPDGYLSHLHLAYVGRKVSARDAVSGCTRRCTWRC